MNLEKQIISIIAFFIFGIIIFLNYNYFSKKKKIKTYMSTIFLTFIFMLILYHLTNGHLHPYFIATYLIGIIFSKISVNHLKNKLLKLKIRLSK